MPASQAKISYNDQLWIGRTVADVTTWTQILGIEDLPLPSKVPPSEDVTHQQSPGRSRETIPGLSDSVEASIEKQLWLGSPSDVLLTDLADDYELGIKEDVLIEFLVDPTATSPLRRTYRGNVTGFVPGANVGTKRMVTVSMSIFERQSTNERPTT